MLKNRGFYWLLVGMALAATPGCVTNVKTSDEDVQIVYYDELVKLLGNKKKPTVLIDVRSADKYAAEHIAGAINIPITEMAANDQRLADAYFIVVYGQNWKNYLSQASNKKLLTLGYRNVSDFRDGLDGWREKGGQIVTANQ